MRSAGGSRAAPELGGGFLKATLSSKTPVTRQPGTVGAAVGASVEDGGGGGGDLRGTVGRARRAARDTRPT